MASNELLRGLIEATLAGSAAIALVLALRRPLRRASGAQVAYALWLLVPLAMLATLLPAATVDIERGPVAQVLVLPQAIVATTAPAQGGIDWRWLLLGLWLCGVAASAGWLWRVQAAFRRRLGHLLPHGEALRAQDANAGLPATLGLWHPQVVLPADFDTRFDATQRALVLAHERRHIARRDAWANAAAALLRCLFWFDPLFHWAAARMRHDQELACDADVLAAHPHQRRMYGDALLKAQLALQTVPLGCHFGFGHPLKERIAMLATPVSTTRRWWGRAVLACLLLGGGYAAWAAQPATPVAIPANGIAADIALQVDEEAPRTLRIVSEADKPFSLETDVEGRHYAITGTVLRVEHQAQPALRLDLAIDEDGKRVSKPKLIVRNGKTAAIQIGEELPAADGRTTFKGLRLDVTLTDTAAKAPGVTMSQDQAGMREVVGVLARDHGMTVDGLGLVPEGKPLSMDMKSVPLEVVLALIGEEAGLDIRVEGSRIAISRKPESAVAAPAHSSEASAQQGTIDGASRMLHPPRYPEDAARQKVTGTTVLIVAIDAQGGVTGVTVERSAGDERLDKAAKEAAMRWTFMPSIKNGKAVAGKVRVPVKFAMDAGDDPVQQARAALAEHGPASGGWNGVEALARLLGTGMKPQADDC